MSKRSPESYENEIAGLRCAVESFRRRRDTWRKTLTENEQLKELLHKWMLCPKCGKYQVVRPEATEAAREQHKPKKQLTEREGLERMVNCDLLRGNGPKIEFPCLDKKRDDAEVAREKQ